MSGRLPWPSESATRSARLVRIRINQLIGKKLARRTSSSKKGAVSGREPNQSQSRSGAPPVGTERDGSQPHGGQRSRVIGAAANRPIPSGSGRKTERKTASGTSRSCRPDIASAAPMKLSASSSAPSSSCKSGRLRIRPTSGPSSGGSNISSPVIACLAPFLFPDRGPSLVAATIPAAPPMSSRVQQAIFPTTLSLTPLGREPICASLALST